MHPTSIRLRVSLSSTELSRQARKELIDPLDGEESLFCWCPCACAVLAVNDLLRAEANDTKYLLASIVWVAISIWFCETDHLSLEEQKHQWNNTVELLMAGRSPLLQRSFNDDVSRALTDGVAPAFDEEVALDGGPDEGYIGAAFEAIRNYTPSKPRSTKRPHNTTSPSQNLKRNHDSSSPPPTPKRHRAHSLSKSAFTPQARWKV